MRRPIVPDAILRKGTARANAARVSSVEPVSRDKRFDNPCTMVGYNRNLNWEFRQTAEDCPVRAAALAEILAKRAH